MSFLVKKIIKFFLRSYSKLKFEYKINIQKDEWFFIFPYGIGDFYLFLSLLTAFQKKNGVNSVSVGLVKPYQAQLLDIFEIKVKKIVFIDKKELQFCHCNNLNQGIPIILHPEYFLKESLYSLIGYNGLTLGDVYKIMLTLPIETIYNKPIINQIVSNAAFEKFNKYNLTDCKNVLLAPHANSFDEDIIPFDFWEILNYELQALGYKVLINSSNKKYVDLKNVIAVDFSLSQAIPFVEMCKIFVGVRSGFCDLISSSKSQKYIIYPKIDWYAGTFLSGSSLISMGLTSDEIIEFEIDSDSIRQIINSIIHEIVKKNKYEGR
jgi:hypothetical protein